MSFLKDVLKVVAILLAVPVVMAFVAYVGYYYGTILSVLTFGLLGDSFGLGIKEVATITAWVFIVAFLLILGLRRKE